MEYIQLKYYTFIHIIVLFIVTIYMNIKDNDNMDMLKPLPVIISNITILGYSLLLFIIHTFILFLLCAYNLSIIAWIFIILVIVIVICCVLFILYTGKDTKARTATTKVTSTTTTDSVIAEGPTTTDSVIAEGPTTTDSVIAEDPTTTDSVIAEDPTTTNTLS
jgi:hypothetical protein